MTGRKGPTKRLMRGEQPRPGRYWTGFMICSVVVHALMLVMFSGVADSFFQSMQRPKPAPSVVYVGLLFTPPKQVTVTKVQPQESPQKVTRREAAEIKPEIAAPEKKSGKPQPSKPSLAGLIGPTAERPRSVKPPVVLRKQAEVEAPNIKASEKSRQPSRRPAGQISRSEPAVSAVPKIETPATKAVDEGPTLAVPAPGPKAIDTKEVQQAGPEEPDFTTDVVDRSYVKFFEPSTDTITLIKAAESTTVARSDIAEPGPVTDMQKPVIRHLSKSYLPPAAGPAPKTAEALSGFSIRAAAEDRTGEPRPTADTAGPMKAASKTTLAEAPVTEPGLKPGPTADMKRPALEHLQSMEPRTDEVPELKTSDSPSGVSIRAASKDRHEPTGPGELAKPAIDIDMAALVTKNEDTSRETENTYPALLGIKGMQTSPRSVTQLNLPTNIVELFEGLFSDYSPSGSRPDALENRSMDTAGLEPAPVPSIEAGRMQTDIAPTPATGDAARDQAAVSEPPTRKPPKVIEVSGYTDVSGEPPTISITNPAPGKTDRSLVEVRGEVTGRGIGSVLFSMGRFKRELLVSDGVFSTTVALERGRNILTVAAADYFGRSARSRVEVDYSPGEEEPIISFITPKDGDIIDAFRDREFEISGTVNGEGFGRVRIYLNRSIKEVPVVDGGFSIRTLADAEENTLYAEAVSAGETSRSSEIRFRVINLFPKDISVLMETDRYSGVKLTHKWRPQPESGETYSGRAPGFIDSSAAAGRITEVERAEAGVYTIGASFDLEPGASVRAVFHVTLYGYDPARKISRSLGPFVLRGTGNLPAVRVLMPECIFWEDDYWFSGMIESSSGTTKFREPEGITWREED